MVEQKEKSDPSTCKFFSREQAGSSAAVPGRYMVFLFHVFLRFCVIVSVGAFVCDRICFCLIRSQGWMAEPLIFYITTADKISVLTRAPTPTFNSTCFFLLEPNKIIILTHVKIFGQIKSNDYKSDGQLTGLLKVDD